MHSKDHMMFCLLALPSPSWILTGDSMVRLIPGLTDLEPNNMMLFSSLITHNEVFRCALQVYKSVFLSASLSLLRATERPFACNETPSKALPYFPRFTFPNCISFRPVDQRSNITQYQFWACYISIFTAHTICISPSPQFPSVSSVLVLFQ